MLGAFINAIESLELNRKKPEAQQQLKVTFYEKIVFILCSPFNTLILVNCYKSSEVIQYGGGWWVGEAGGYMLRVFPVSPLCDPTLFLLFLMAGCHCLQNFLPFKPSWLHHLCLICSVSLNSATQCSFPIQAS